LPRRGTGATRDWRARNFRPAVGPEFTGLESHLTRWEDQVSTEDIVELAKSRSYYLAAGEGTRAKVRGNLDWYLYEHLAHARGDVIGLPYLTQTWRAFKACVPQPKR
jgi:hypothetical protein